MLQNRLSLCEFKNLSDAASEISGRMSLLDSAQLDKIDVKLGSILSKMDTLADKKGGPEMVEQEKKVRSTLI